MSGSTLLAILGAQWTLHTADDDAGDAGSAWVRRDRVMACAVWDAGKERLQWGDMDDPEDAKRLSRFSSLKTIAVVPGEDVGARRVALPAKSDRQARAAAPFAVEDALAQDVDDTRVAVGAKGDGATRIVHVVSGEQAERWKAALSDHGLSADRVVADFAALPGTPDRLLVLDAGDRVMVSRGDEGFAAARVVAGAVIAAELEAHPELAVTVWSDDAGALAPSGGWGAREVSLEAGPDAAGVLEAMARRLTDGERPLDLRREVLGRAVQTGEGYDWGQWRGAAVLGLAVMGAVSGAGALEAQRLDAAARAVRAQTVAVYRSAFPDEQRVPNPVAQIRPKAQAAAGRAASFLDLSDLVAQGVADVDGMRVESMTFEATRGELRVTLLYDRFEDMEALGGAIREAGGDVREGASRRRGELMTGDVVVGLK